MSNQTDLPDLAFILGERFAAECRDQYTEAELAEIRYRNISHTDDGCCATHDFADANMIMDPCFTEVMGRELDFSEADCAIWNAGWDHAKKHHLTAAADAPKPIDALTAEYEAYCQAQGIPLVSADEQDFEGLTPDQRAWVGDFIDRWEAASDAEYK